MRYPADLARNVRTALTEVWRKLDPLYTGNFDLGGRRIINAGKAQSGGDYTTLDDVKKQIQVDLAPVSPSGIDSLKPALYGTHAQRLEIAPSPSGVLFYETDRTSLYQAQNVSGTLSWVWVSGSYDTNTAPTDLGTNDVGFTWHYTTYWREYRWSGSAWADAPNSPPRRFIQFFHVAPTPLSAWQLCDGSTVNRSNSTGGTTSYTVPDLITDNRELRANTVAGGTGGATTAITSNPSPGTTGADNGGGTVVAAGVGATVASHTHDHDYSHDHTVSTVDPYYDALPYVRL